MTTTPTDLDEVLIIAEQWMAQDPDPVTVCELRQLLTASADGDEAARAELLDAFAGTLQFGTAGLRGRLGPGSYRMNRVVVTRAAAGLAAYLQQRGGRSVVIGYDARRNSDVFARDTAEIMAGAGLTAYLLPRHLPTPVTAYCIRPLGCDAGVMVTASHNPPDDNGYKVYLGDGSQIIPPADTDISDCIAAVGDIRELRRSSDYLVLDDTLVEQYINRAISVVAPGGPRDIKSVYTPLHGVGGATFTEAAIRAGFPQPIPVAAQFEPDGRFPTVAFPNPEEPGAMDLAFETAVANDAEIVVANDPDADRCAAAIPTADGWRMLTGDEVGALLGWWKLERARRAGETLHGTYANSVVSGTLLSKIARAAGLDHATTLTGFKWISKAPGLIYGYEEALGYCVDPEAVADKDGINATLLMLELAATLKADGRTVQDALDEIAVTFGLHLNSQLAIRVADIALIHDAMVRLRANPPNELAGMDVARLDDLAVPTDGVPPTEGLRFILDGARVTIRPSGTEPKLKCYLEVIVPVEGDAVDARAEAAAKITELRAAVSAVLGL